MTGWKPVPRGRTRNPGGRRRPPILRKGSRPSRRRPVCRDLDLSLYTTNYAAKTKDVPLPRSQPVAARKKKNLVIVESPAKARTINKYLGPDFEVVASKGHVRDLIKSRIGIDIENGWVPTYRALVDRKEVLAALKKQVAGAGMVYLAPDPDREGEAIAWHLKEALGLKDDCIRRVTFNEITK